MEPCWTVMVAFEERLTVRLDGAFVEDSPLAWIARNSSKPQRASEPDHWVLHASPQWSEENLEANPDQVIRDLLQAFTGSTGLALPKTKLAIAHRWRYARGAAPDRQSGFLHHAETRLTLIGDWLYDGRVEGAFLSGWDAAESLLLNHA
jgi:renalase